MRPFARLSKASLAGRESNRRVCSIPTSALNPAPGLPDEGDFLAWVEGEPLPRDREKAVALALGQDKALARRLEAMRADRKALKSLPEVPAPAGLLAGVEAALQPVLERQMLLGLRDGEPVASHPPVSIVQPVKRSIAQTFFADRMGRRLAMAAGLLLVVGGATYMITTYYSGRTTPRRPITIAAAAPERAAPSPGAPSKAAETPAERGTAKPEREIATAPAPETAPQATVATHDAPDYDASAMGPFAPALDGARAAALAREGRLVIRVTALDPGIASEPGKLMERVRHADQNMLRVGEEAPASLTALLNPSYPHHEIPAHSPARVNPALASNEAPPSLPEGMYGPPPPPPDWQPPVPQLIYLVQARLDGEAMDTLKAALSGGYGKAEFEELAGPLPEAMPAVNGASVLWWNQAPAGWTWWASVPVVVDTDR